MPAPPPSPSASSSRELRVFISSTFRDMQAERDELVKRVFPQIRRLCEERDVAWSEVDLRWGVTDEQRAEGATLPLCLAEIDRCRPYFLCLLGERYGWIPEDVPETALAKEPWLRDRLDRSVTELEILHAVLNDPRKGERAYFYFRDPAWATRPGADPAIYLERPWPSEISKLGRDEAERSAASRRAKLADLKRRIRDSRLPVRDNFADPRALGDLVLRDLTDLIERLYPQDAPADELDRETQGHEAFVRARERTYVRRQELDAALDDFFSGTESRLAIVGDVGSGKTATLAHFVATHKHAFEATRPSFFERVRSWFTGASSRPFVISHFVGATPQSADWKKLVLRILGEIRRRRRRNWELPEDSYELRYALQDWAPFVRGRLLLILDGLDRLDEEDDALDLAWLPAELPPNVRIVASAGPGRVREALLRKGWRTIEIAGLTPAERREFVAAFLERFGKKLAPQQIDRIALSDKSADPSFLSPLLDELRQFGFHENLDQRIGSYLASRDVEELYLKIFDRYEEDYERDRPGLVREALSLLWAARRGLSEAELLDLLGENGAALPRLYLSPFLLAAEDWFVNRSGLLSLANESLRRAVRRRYLDDPATERAVRGKLATYLRDRPISRRVVEELLEQQRWGERWEELRDTLLDFDRLKVFANERKDEVRELMVGWEALAGRYDPGDCYSGAAERLVAAKGSTREVADVLSQCGRLLHSLGHSGPAGDLHRRALAIREAEASPDAGEILNDLTMIGRTFQVANRLSDALEAFERASDLALRQYGARSSEFATIHASIGGVHYLMGGYEAARQRIQQGYAILAKLHGEEDEQVLSLRDNLSTVLRAMGRYAEAGRHAREVLDIRRRLHGDEHPDTIFAMVTVASLCLEEGAFDEAIALFERCLAQRDRTLGPNHPRTLNVVHNLAAACQQRGATARAKKLFERALEATKRSVGELHPDYAVEAMSLAECHRLSNEFDDAERLYRQALDLMERSGDLVAASTCLHNLGLLYVQTKRPAEASPILERALAIRQERLGTNHDDTGNTWLVLAGVRLLSGEDEEAKRCIERGVKALTAALGPGHRMLVLRVRQLAHKLRLDGREDLAKFAERSAGVDPPAPMKKTANVPPPGSTDASASSSSDSEQTAAVQERMATLVREMELLARTRVAPSSFFDAFLPRLVLATQALGGAAWHVDAQGDVRRESETTLPEEFASSSPLASGHLRFLRTAAACGRFCNSPPRSWMPDAPDVTNPTSCLIRTGGLSAQGRFSYVVELAFRPGEDSATAQNRDAAFQRSCRIAQDYLDRRFPVAPARSPASSPMSAAIGTQPQTPVPNPAPAGASGNASGAADPAVLEQVRATIRNLVEETRLLAEMNLPPEAFLREFLARFRHAVGGEGAAIWNVSPIGELRIEIDLGLPSPCRIHDAAEAVGHRDLIRHIATSRGVAAVRSGGVLDRSPRLFNRTPYLLLIGYLEAGDQGTLVCEVARIDRGDERVVAGLLKFLEAMRAVAAPPLRRYFSGAS